ncbi:hypothetical protein Vadar_027194 [Vaccinium darrowii]|uniref:Uncharacterized protein n=1 Tax=Vaccinium darrowii TaxID=229202 RepID=A0ACB7ZMT7_9ERIC|nr:hypothetical protein Vadar_027194 [Vaccinium darrowii]
MLLGCLSLATQIHGQEPQDKSDFQSLIDAITLLLNFEGFISIDCGMPEGYTARETYYSSDADFVTEGYTAGETYYSSDADFVNTGINSNISAEYKTGTLDPRLVSLRSFPQGNRTCYTLRPAQGKNNTYLIRASFLYGNYDGQKNPPKFDLYIGVNLWEKVAMSRMNITVTTEIMYESSTDYIHVCLLNTGAGTPFISALELKHLNGSIYKSESGCMAPIVRNYMGLPEVGVAVTDELGRSWSYYNMTISANIASTFPINSQSSNDYYLPLDIMKKGVKAVDYVGYNGSLIYVRDQGGVASNFYAYLHFCDVEQTQNDELREFNISLNYSPWLESIEPVYLKTTTVHKKILGAGSGAILLTFERTNRSTLPPILNALELYVEKELPQSPTVPEDVDAMVNISLTYGVKKNWQGDPCVPMDFSWDRVNCSYDGNNSPQVIGLNLSSSDLNGEIPPALSALKSLRYLDLSYNSLTGPVPEFLAQLPDLVILNLTNNDLTGSVPKALSEKSSLSLSLDGNPNLCQSDTCEQTKKKKKNLNTVIIVASVVLSVVLLSAIAILWSLKRRRHTVGRTLKSKNRRFTYSEVVTITNNFQKVIGKGGFGTVYLGYLEDGTEVAVKMLSRSSSQGSEQFWTEAELLTTVHHRNLASLIGYCDEGSNTALIYEYMANGNLQECLLDKNRAVLTREQRLQIAIDAAQALEYLHNGCKPPIIHRDIKTANILLTEKLQAKVADFGLSRIFPDEDGSHVSTAVVGTFGYLDPEYYITSRLTEKSDVYSFGVVLLELITGQPAIIKSEENTHIVQWVMPRIERGEISSIADPRLQGDFDSNSVWKMLETAIACVPSSPIQRLTMNQVLGELNECLEIYLASRGPLEIDEVNKSSSRIDYLCDPLDLESSMSGPQAR